LRQRGAILIAPIALIVVAVFGTQTHGFISGMALGFCIVLAVTSGVVLALVGTRSGYVRTVPADDADLADLAVLEALEPLRVEPLRVEPLRVERPEDQR